MGGCNNIHPEVRVGSGGKYRSRMADEILRAAESEGVVCARAKSYEVPISTGGTVSVFLPHEWYPELVQDRGVAPLCFSEADLAAGGGLCGQLREWAESADVNLEGPLSSVAALGLHVDGVQYTSSVRAGSAKSIVVGAMNIVSGTRDDIKNRRQPLFLLRKARLCQCGCQGFHTMQELMEVLAWSMQCLADGLSPSTRHDGSAWTEHDLRHRIANNIDLPTAALLQVRGDWEGLQQLFNLRSVGADHFCWMCNSTRFTDGPMHYSDFRPDAAHRASLITHAEYTASCARERVQPSFLFRCPGLKLQHLTVDVMHAADLGTFQDAIGSLFWLEISHKPWHRSQKIGLERLNRALNLFYSAHANDNLSKVTPVSYSQIYSKNPGFPTLKAKAAQTRHLIDFCVTLAQQHQHGTASRPPFRFRANHRLAARTDEHRQNMVSLFVGMQEFARSLLGEPFDPAAARRGMYQYLTNLKDLNTLWRDGAAERAIPKLPFHLRPKCHACQHLVEDKLDIFGNPSSFWCYRDEDFVGCVKIIARKTMHPATLERRVMQKLRILAALTDGFL